MNSYGLFAEDAIQKYKELPEERNELYKRKYVSLSPDHLLDIFHNESSVPDNEDEIKELSKSFFVDNAVKFDAVIWGGGHSISPSSKNINIVQVSEIKMDTLNSKLYKSSEDKLAALVHAFTREIVFINVAKGEKAKINLLFVNSAQPLATQVIVNAEDRSELELFEWYSSVAQENSANAVMHECVAGAYSNVSVDAVLLLFTILTTNSSTIESCILVMLSFTMVAHTAVQRTTLRLPDMKLLFMQTS